jgi:hypothetical protein
MLNIIRRKWLPLSLGALAIWYANFYLKFAQVAATLGLSGQVAQVGKDNDSVQWLSAALEASDTSAASLRLFRDETLFGAKSDPAPAEPVNVLPEFPEAFQTAIITRLVDLVEKKIQTADNYTPDIGAQLGIVVPSSDPISPENLSVEGKYYPALSGYEMGVVVFNRGDAESADLEIRFDGSEVWKKIKTFTGKTVSIVIEPTTPGQPQRVQARIQLYRKNEKYGQPSPALYVTLNP